VGEARGTHYEKPGSTEGFSTLVSPEKRIRLGVAKRSSIGKVADHGPR
jgi:hypothetical protein